MARVQENKTSRAALAALVIGLIAAFALVGGISLVVYDALDDETVSGPVPGTTVEDSTSAPTSTGDVSVPFSYGTGECPRPPKPDTPPRRFDDAPQKCIRINRSYEALVTTNRGKFTIALDPQTSPGNVNNFVTLARWGYYDGTMCHRVIRDFDVQCGRPGDDEDAPGYTVPDELPAPGSYELGVVAMANTGRPDSAGGQWFVVTGDAVRDIPPTYSIIGRVTSGFDTTVARMNELGDPTAPNGGPPTEPIRIRSVVITESQG